MQMIGIHSIEDCLEILTGLQKHNLQFEINPSDATIMNSVARQIFKGTALTDRQYNLMKEKLQNYREQFESQDIIGFDRALETLRLPLRQIDRSKYITIVDTLDVYKNSVYESYKEKLKWIKVRFPFKKSDIMLINQISAIKDYVHQKGSHEHFFILNEKNVYNILSKFSDKNYVIDEELKEIYKKILDIKSNKGKYLSAISDEGLLNFNPRIKEIAEEEVGEFNLSNKLLYIDRRFRYSINNIEVVQPYSLEEKIAYRSDLYYQSKPSEETVDNIMSALWNLKRFPMLVILDKLNPEHQLYELANFYRDILPNEEQSVLFRLDGESGFNQLIHDRKLNNWVDKDTKIVYISSDKLPKLLVNSDFKPCVTFSYTSKLDRIVDSYVKSKCDLIVFREEEISPFRKYSRYYANL